MSKEKCSGFPKETGFKEAKISVPAHAPAKVSGTPDSQPITSGKNGKTKPSGGLIGGKI